MTGINDINENDDFIHHCKGTPPADMLINDISKLFDDSIRRKSANYPDYENFGGNKGFGARNILFHLARIARKSDGAVNQRALVKLTHLTAPTISVALQKMEAQGLIVREHNPDDMRETMVKLTKKGLAVEDFIKKSIDETRNVMFADISEDEISSLTEILLKIERNMMNED